MYGSLNSAMVFLISTLFDIYLLVLCLRLILAWSRADYFNPITRVVIQLTQPIIAPIRRIIPNYARIEFAALFFIILLEIIKICLMSWIILGSIPLDITIFIAVFEAFIKLLLNVFLYSILFYVLMSWIAPGYSPLYQVLWQLSAPVLRPCQRWIPTVGGVDLSPVAAIIILQFLIILI